MVFTPGMGGLHRPRSDPPRAPRQSEQLCIDALGLAQIEVMTIQVSVEATLGSLASLVHPDGWFLLLSGQEKATKA